MDIVLHKANRIDNNEEITGFITKMFGQCHIIKVDDENSAYPIKEDTIKPCIEAFEVRSVRYETIPYLSFRYLLEMGMFHSYFRKCIIVKKVRINHPYKDVPVVIHEGKINDLNPKYYDWKVDKFYFTGFWCKVLHIQVSELS